MERWVAGAGPEAETTGLRLKLLEQALSADSRSVPALNRLLDFGDGGNPDAEAVRMAHELLESLIAVGESAPFAHLALGIKAWTQAEPGEAIWYLERAYKLEPSYAVLANDLAWVLAHDQNKPDVRRALGIINTVLKAHPDEPAYIETRGQILAKLERWDEALDDPERALPHDSDNIQLHDTVATAYRHLGRNSLAEKHALIVKTLTQQPGSK